MTETNKEYVVTATHHSNWAESMWVLSVTAPTGHRLIFHPDSFTTRRGALRVGRRMARRHKQGKPLPESRSGVSVQRYVP